jgi:hypothetical protein
MTQKTIFKILQDKEIEEKEKQVDRNSPQVSQFPLFPGVRENNKPKIKYRYIWFIIL